MKKTLVSAAFALLLSVQAFASPVAPVKPIRPFASQLEFLLGKNDFNKKMVKLQARVLFTFDAENRIRVIEVDSKNHSLKSFIIEKLDGQKLYVNGSLEGKRFVLPIRIAS